MRGAPNSPLPPRQLLPGARPRPAFKEALKLERQLDFSQGQIRLLRKLSRAEPAAGEPPQPGVGAGSAQRGMRFPQAEGPMDIGRFGHRRRRAQLRHLGGGEQSLKFIALGLDGGQDALQSLFGLLADGLQKDLL
jgi:hypothetical protein